MNLKLFSKLWVVYGLLAFPMFYFVYKYGTPDQGLNDYYSYYKLYSNWDISNVDAPFNMRLLSSYFVFLFNKAGLHYDTVISFSKEGHSQQVFFNAILFNYLCIVSTCIVLYTITRRYFSDILLCFSSGLIYLLGFGTLFYEMMPITDSLSVLLFAIVLHGYLQKKWFIIIPLLLLILQREYVFLALGLVCVLDYWKLREKYYLYTLITCIVCFGIYYVMRKTIFYTPKYDHQASPAYFLDSIVTIKFPLGPYIKQTLMTMNLFILYMFVVAYKKYRKMSIDKFELVKLIFLFLQINIISFAAVFGNNTGRYFYILIPLVIVQLVRESAPLLRADAYTGK